MTRALLGLATVMTLLTRVAAADQPSPPPDPVPVPVPDSAPVPVPVPVPVPDSAPVPVPAPPAAAPAPTPSAALAPPAVPAPPPPGPIPEPPARRGLLLAPGEVMIAGSTFNVNLTTDLVGKPVSLAPSVYYGAKPGFTIGITHDAGTTPFTPRPGIRTATHASMGTTLIEIAGTGVCISGTSHRCPKVYDNVGLDSLGSVLRGKLDLATHIGLDAFTISDPRVIQLRIGALGRYQASDQIAITFDPRVGVGVTQRDAGNKETIDAPVWVWFLVDPRLGLYLSTGLASQLQHFTDAYTIKLGAGGSFTVGKVTLGADFLFSNALGKAHTFAERLFALRAAYSF